MNNDELQELAERYVKTKDSDLKEGLARKALYLTERTAKRISGKQTTQTELDERISLAAFGLAKAIHTYEQGYEQGYNFKSWAITEMRSEIIERIRISQNRLIEPLMDIPEEESIETVKQIRDRLNKKSEHEGMAYYILCRLNGNAKTKSLDERGDYRYRPIENIPDEKSDNPLEKAAISEFSRELLKNVTENKRRILKAIYWEGKSVNQVAKEENLTPGRISQIARFSDPKKPNEFVEKQRKNWTELSKRKNRSELVKKLRDKEGMSFADISSRLGVHRETVSAAYAKGKERKRNN
tara:strand:+ start:255 stop:1145 length:891 start_codon:yes stop_codon:yes gene_type:complete